MENLMLNERDIEILNHRKKGLTLKEIAVLVFLSIDTVDKRLRKLRKRTGCKNDIELLCYFTESGLFNENAA